MDMSHNWPFTKSFDNSDAHGLHHINSRHNDGVHWRFDCGRIGNKTARQHLGHVPQLGLPQTSAFGSSNSDAQLQSQIS